MKPQHFTEPDFALALKGDLSGIRAIPKADLHVHSSLSAPFEAIQKISPNIELPPEEFDDFNDFFSYIQKHFFPLYKEKATMAELIKSSYDAMKADGVTNCEISFDLQAPHRMGVSWKNYTDFLKALNSRLSPELQVHADLGLKRELEVDYLKQELPKALDTGFFSAIDIYGNYQADSLKKFKPIADLCVERGISIKLHTGEFLETDSIEQDLSFIECDAIQHGITIIHHPKLMAVLAEKGTIFNVCPTSNVKLAHVQSYAEHPIRKMIDAGLQVTIGTDDLSLFGASCSEEYLHLYKTGNFSVEELEEIRARGLEAAGNR